jgi:release factor glutamine methyltransferase
MTIKQAYHQLFTQLATIYHEREAANISDWVIEHITSYKRVDRIMFQNNIIGETQLQQLSSATKKLLQHQPVQYALGEAWFAGMKFYVNENVLIPRPETEELVEWIIEEIKNENPKNKKIIDIGTGSGCIPIALKKKIPELNVHALDISEKALKVAMQNADTLNASIDFKLLDFLEEANWQSLPQFDVIVSNPPYIKQSEESDMNENVLRYEPHLALFVADNDALIFYKKIAAFGKNNLTPGGKIFVELNETLGKETAELFESFGYQTELRKDMQGKNRMIKATIANSQ